MHCPAERMGAAPLDCKCAPLFFWLVVARGFRSVPFFLGCCARGLIRPEPSITVKILIWALYINLEKYEHTYKVGDLNLVNMFYRNEPPWIDYLLCQVFTSFFFFENNWIVKNRYFITSLTSQSIQWHQTFLMSQNGQNFAAKSMAPNFEHNRSSKEEKDNRQRIIEATYSDPYIILLVLSAAMSIEILFFRSDGWIILFACPTH
jgi:hypothetical protein